jgi:hypothetical protein
MILPVVTDVGLPTVATAVVVFLIARIWFGSAIFAPRFMGLWGAIRRWAAPIVQQQIYSRIGYGIQIEREVPKRQSVGVVDLSATELAQRLDTERPVEVPLLAGTKTDWDGNDESGTFIWYCGPRVSWLPRWLSKYQVHVSVFQIGQRFRVTAHREANSWRPDLWIDHLTRGPSHSTANGVQRSRRALRDVSIPFDTPWEGA